MKNSVNLWLLVSHWDCNSYMSTIIFIEILNRKILCWILMVIWNWLILDFLSKLLTLRWLRPSVAHPNIWLQKWFYKKVLINPLIGGLWEYFYMSFILGFLPFTLLMFKKCIERQLLKNWNFPILFQFPKKWKISSILCYKKISILD